MDENLTIDKYVDLHRMVDELQEMVKRFTEKPFVDRMEEQSDLENARMNVEVMYVLNALFWCQLKLQGRDAANHPVMKELNSIREKLRMIKEHELRGKGPKVNISAAKRLIQHDLWSLESSEDRNTKGSNERTGSRKRNHSKSSEEEGELLGSSSDDQPTSSSGLPK